MSGVALTNDPFFNTMPAVAASTAIQPGSPTGKPNKGQHMNPYAKIAAALGMPEDSTEESVVLECSKLKSGMPMMQASVDKAIEPLRAQLKAQAEQVEALKAANAKKDAELFTRDVDGVIEAAKREGFACEPMRDSIIIVAQAKGLAEAKKLAESAAKVNVTTTGTGNANANTVTASAQQYAAALEEHEKKTGLSGRALVSDFHRTNPAMAKALVASIPAAPSAS